MIAAPTRLGDLFAFQFALGVPKHEHSYRDCFNDELIRLRLSTSLWRLTEINQNYKLCPSYPKYCVVPSAITDEEISEAAKFRSDKRFPTKSQLKLNAPACHSVAIDPFNSKLCYCCCSDGSIVIYDIHNQSLVESFGGHSKHIHHLNL